MDLRKAKLILIVIFLIINMVLLSVLIFTSDDDKVDKDVLEDIYELFENRDKEIACDIPDTLRPLPQLGMSDDKTIGREDVTDKDALDFDTGDYELLYSFDAYMIYAQRYRNRLILENSIKIYPGHIEYSYRDIIGFEKATKSIIPAYTMLLKEYLNSEVRKIELIELVYMKYQDEDIIGPVWYIVADGKPRYFYAFDAFNGIEMTILEE